MVASGVQGIFGASKAMSGNATTKIISSIAGRENSLATATPGGSTNQPMNITVYKSPFETSQGRVNQANGPMGGVSALPKEFQDAINWKQASVNDSTFLGLGAKVVKEGLAGVKQLLQA